MAAQPRRTACATTAAIPSFEGRLMTERILVPKTPSFTARVRRASSAGIGFIRLTPSFSAFQPFADLQKGVFPKESRNRRFLRLAVHHAFEKDRRDDLSCGEGWRGHDAHPHLMHKPEHFSIAAIGAVRARAVAARTLLCARGGIGLQPNAQPSALRWPPPLPSAAAKRPSEPTLITLLHRDCVQPTTDGRWCIVVLSSQRAIDRRGTDPSFPVLRALFPCYAEIFPC